MSAQFKPGDRVEYVGNPKSGYVSNYLIGKHGTVAQQENLSRGSVPVKWDHRPLVVDGVLALNIRHLPDAPEPEDTDDPEPEPLKEGDWVQVWAQVNRLRSDGDTVIRFFYGVKHADGTPKDHYDERVRNDAIVRPAAGQVPPWVKPAQCTSLWEASPNDYARCIKDEHDDTERHNRPGVFWTTAEEYGRVEVSS